MDRQRTAVSVLVGALVSIVAGFLPILSFGAPLLGGSVAGYLQRSGLREGASTGALMGVFLAILGVIAHLLGSLLPPLPIAVLLGPWARGFGLGIESILIIFLASTILLIIVGAIGGVIGGWIASERAA